MFSRPGLPLLLLAVSVAVADSRPRPGSYGFNWLDAGSSCRKLSEEDVASLSKCSVSSNAFGLALKSHTCRLNSRVELIVYDTAAQCQQALETMQANGD